MRKRKVFLPALALGVAGAISTAAPSLADPITYAMQFIGTGSLGTSSFTQANVTLTMDNDTGSIMLVSGLYEINGPATVNVSGVNGGGPATFTDTMQVFTDSISDVGFFDANVGFDVVDVFSTAFSGYQLGGLTAPITDTAQLGLPGVPEFPTDAGNLILTGLGTGTSATATFTATATVAAIPEPPIGRGLSIAVAVGGIFLGASLLRRQRFRNPLT